MGGFDPYLPRTGSKKTPRENEPWLLFGCVGQVFFFVMSAHYSPLLKFSFRIFFFSLPNAPFQG